MRGRQQGGQCNSTPQCLPACLLPPRRCIQHCLQSMPLPSQASIFRSALSSCACALLATPPPPSHLHQPWLQLLQVEVQHPLAQEGHLPLDGIHCAHSAVGLGQAACHIGLQNEWKAGWVVGWVIRRRGERCDVERGCSGWGAWHGMAWQSRKPHLAASCNRNARRENGQREVVVRQMLQRRPWAAKRACRLGV